MGTLTVRENLRFSAALRLPSSVPQSEKEARVNHLIKELGLTKVADSKVSIHTLLIDRNFVVRLWLEVDRWVPFVRIFLRWAHRWPGESLAERGRGRTLVWSWLLIPQFFFWMNQPLGWMPVQLTRSCCYWKGIKYTLMSFLIPLILLLLYSEPKFCLCPTTTLLSNAHISVNIKKEIKLYHMNMYDILMLCNSIQTKISDILI